jgi:hypothetical protein
MGAARTNQPTAKAMMKLPLVLGLGFLVLGKMSKSKYCRRVPEERRGELATIVDAGN